MKFTKYYKAVDFGEDEKILTVIKHHIIPYSHKIIIGLLLLLLPFFFMFSLLAQGPIGVSIFSALIFLAIIFICREWYVWSNNVFIITNQRIIDIDQKGFFSKTVSEVAFEKIMDISYVAKGLIATLFGLGTIYIKTSIPDLSLMMQHVGQVKKVISELIETAKKGGAKNSIETTTAQKLENLEEVLNYDDDSEIHEYKLKDLIEEYVEIYSKDSLKKLLLSRIKDKE